MADGPVPTQVRLNVTRFPGGTLVTWITTRVPREAGGEDSSSVRVSSFLEAPFPSTMQIAQAAIDAVRAQTPHLR